MRWFSFTFLAASTSSGGIQALRENVRLVDVRAKLRADAARLTWKLQGIRGENARIERWRREGQ